MIRYLSLVLYVLFTVIAHAILNYPVMDAREGLVDSGLRLIVSAQVTGMIGLFMIWISLLPAGWAALRMKAVVLRYLVLWAGYIVFFAPVWLETWVMEEGDSALFRNLSIAATAVFAGVVAVVMGRPRVVAP